MSVQLLRSRLDSILQFMSPYWNWVNCHMVNYLTDHHWETFVPLGIKREISSPDLIEECIETVFWSLEKHLEGTENAVKFPEIVKFCLQAQKHCLHAFKDIIISPEEFGNRVLGINTIMKQQIKIKEFLTEKKRHEVEVTAELINYLISASPWQRQCVIVDAGDGKGYLSSRLAIEYGHKVLGIDSNLTNTENAIERSKRLKKAWSGLTERAELESKGITPTRRGNWKQKRENKASGDYQGTPLNDIGENYKTIDRFITSNMDLISLFQQQFPDTKTSIPPPVCLTGLHTCGNLAATCLKLFHAESQCKLICNIGCCYHLLKEQFSENEFFGNKQVSDLNTEIGFPLSKYLQEKQVKLGRNARMLAAQSVERTMSAKELPNISLFYRALLELLICEEHPEFKNSVQVGKLRKFSNFNEYVELCRKKYPNLNFLGNRAYSIEEIEKKTYEKKYLDLFYLLRMTFAPVLESLILLDRLLYLKELGHMQSFLIPVFDPVVSPRHFAIVAIKN